MSAPSTSAPRIWGLLGARHGDNQQVRALAGAVAEALGWPCALKQLHYNRLYMLPNILLGPSTASLTAACRCEIAEGPWPDLVIGVGRRSVPIAGWIRARSGGRARLVQIGRPRAPLNLFDLVVTTPQYGLPEAGNVLHNLLPLGSVGPAPEPGVWRERWQDLPRPLIGVLLGGSRWPLRLGGAAGAELGKGAARLVRRIGAGSLMAAGGPRTEAAALTGFAAGAPECANIYPFAPGADNPYQAMLALCDQFVVTGDSVSMLAEAAATGKPVHVFPVPRSPTFGLGLAGRLPGLKPLRPLVSAGLISPARDVERFHRRLYRAGLAAPLEQARADAPGKSGLADEMEITVGRITRLMEGR